MSERDGMSTNGNDKTAIALITGGTGSFGRTMLGHLLERGYSTVRIFSRDEEKQHLMRSEFKDERVEFHIGDVRDRDSVMNATRGVRHVFHAAALKQVPSCEFFPLEAFKTNVLGSENVLDASISNGVEKVVLLSTDKAVLPINALGFSKAMMEKLVFAKARQYRGCNTICSVVRYGNVTGSRGSVIPHFLTQLQAGNPLTVTNPDMTRFMLPLPHTVQLVDHALAHSRPGDLFVRKAPATTVGTIADAMIEIFSSKAGIKIIGERHGEKLFETLATAAELHRSEDMGTHIRIPVDERDMNYELYYEKGHVGELSGEDYHSHNTERLDLAATRALLMSLPIIKSALAAVRDPDRAD